MRFFTSTESTVAVNTTASAAKGNIFAGACANTELAATKPSEATNVASKDFFKITPK
jgi:hypothetical protein